MNIKNFMRCSPLLLVLLVAAGSARAQANLEVNTPAIAALQSSMQQRHAELAPLFAPPIEGLEHCSSAVLARHGVA